MFFSYTLSVLKIMFRSSGLLMNSTRLAGITIVNSLFCLPQDLGLPSEDTLLHVADILSLLASSTRGRRHLLYGEKHDMFTRTK